MKKIENYNTPEHLNKLYMEEASSSIGLAHDIAAKVNELVDAFNELNSSDLEWKQTQEGEIRKGVLYMKDNLLNSLNDLMVVLRESGFIDDRIEFHYKDIKGNVELLTSRLENLLGKVTEGTSSMDAEIIDARTGYDEIVYSNIGQAIREQFRNADLVKKQATMETDESGNKFYTDEFNDFNNPIPNSYVVYTDHIETVANHPYKYKLPSNSTGSLLTLSNRAGKNNGYGGGAIQIYFDRNSNVFYRFYWSNKWSEWLSFDKYQTIILSTNSNEINPEPFDNVDNLPANSFVIYSFVYNTVNLPKNEPGCVLSISRSGEPCGSNGNIQIYISPMGNMYTRMYWSNRWLSWQKITTEKDLETINAKLDNLVTQVDLMESSVTLFEHIGVIGDSYASGHLYKHDGTSIGEFQSLAWNQIMGRRNGISVVPFAKGGLSTRTWLTDSNGLSKLQSSESQQLYILCLGINDRGKLGTSYLGSANDMKADYTQNPDTFYGNYAKIIEYIKVKAPNSKIIMSAMHKNDESDYITFNNAIEEIANHYNIPVIRQYEDPFFHTETYLNKNGGHPTAIAHSGMALAMERLIGKCIVANKDYFGEYIG